MSRVEPTEPLGTGNAVASLTNVRRWDAAQTNRLNNAHWERVTGSGINSDLIDDLKTLHVRVAYEIQNNPILEGVIETHATDVAGATGPTLQVQSNNEAYNTELERLWKDWWADPDAAGKLAGVDKIHLWIRSLWSTGEIAEQIIDEPNAGTEITARLLSIDPRRIDSPPSTTGSGSVILGVAINKNGRPLGYFVGSESTPGALDSLDFGEPIRAENFIHEFKLLEPGQVRGVPIIAPALQVIADIRDLDAQVLDAVRAAADMSVVLESDHESIAPITVSSSGGIDVERRTIWNSPPGWKAKQLKPEHPHVNIINYRRDRLRELGRPANMPLLIITLDASGHNFSSAKLDTQGYVRAVRAIRGWLERRILNRLVRLIEREGLQQLRAISRTRPADVAFVWNWPDTRPKADPMKEAKATELLLSMGIISEIQAIAENGGNAEEVIKEREKYRELIAAAELETEIETDGESIERAISSIVGTVLDERDAEEDSDDDVLAVPTEENAADLVGAGV